eukprot:TRINITY_DN13963_c0_g1_i1.p1 TRINITY_DN13963_c0_g1~~TRINITY_DN13963_c0_g1_i1.p1  ORF type:complete len:229 (+),score=47.75 TRINITY_DN13963_c0_g1_i1:23-688(+)
MQIQLMSFGFKNGRPGKADAVLNARGVANPGTAAQRKRKTGCDKDLHADVMRDPKALAIIADIVRLAEEAAAGCRAACSSNTLDAAPLAPLADGGTADGASTPCCSRSDDEPAEERDEAGEESQEDEEEEEEEEDMSEGEVAQQQQQQPQPARYAYPAAQSTGMPFQHQGGAAHAPPPPLLPMGHLTDDQLRLLQSWYTAGFRAGMQGGSPHSTLSPQPDF